MLDNILVFAKSNPLVFTVLALGLVVFLMLVFVVFTIKKIAAFIKFAVFAIFILILSIFIYFSFIKDRKAQYDICETNPGSYGCWVCENQDRYSDLTVTQCNDCNDNPEAFIVGSIVKCKEETEEEGEVLSEKEIMDILGVSE
ncbi:hypothetical protein GF362_02700 [Candidatus Dojkabacteria bacterium]|nr:hypothetical protein [Candidatus Dojkabacteria bacterium]